MHGKLRHTWRSVHSWIQAASDSASRQAAGSTLARLEFHGPCVAEESAYFIDWTDLITLRGWLRYQQ